MVRALVEPLINKKKSNTTLRNINRFFIFSQVFGFLFFAKTPSEGTVKDNPKT
jgi:hypothetical protein